MDKNFSLYLTKLGFFDENTAKEIIKSNSILYNKYVKTINYEEKIES